MKKGVGLPYTNWSGGGAALLMSLRSDETNQHKGKKLWYVMRGLMKVSM